MAAPRPPLAAFMLDRGNRPEWAHQVDPGPWPNGLTGAGPQAEYSMGDWGWRTDPSIGPISLPKDNQFKKRFTRHGFSGYFNSAYGDDIDSRENGMNKAALLFMIPYLLSSGFGLTGSASVRNLVLGVALLFWMLTPAVPCLLGLGA